MADEFVNVRILDNFYQTSSFFPMPVVLISTLDESGKTNLGPYSLVFPHLIADKRGIILIGRASSNTAKNILRTGVCAVNFIPDKKRYLKSVVELGFPGETTEEKMESSIFTLIPSARADEERQPNTQYPDIVKESIQVFECTWDDGYSLELNEETEEIHFVLLLDKIVMKKRWWEALLEGKRFPKLPLGFGFRNNINFWFASHSRPFSIPVPSSKGVNVDAVKFAATRYDPSIPWQEEAYAKLVRIPRVFMGKVVAQIIDTAKAEGIDEITPEFLDRVRDKRDAEKRG